MKVKRFFILFFLISIIVFTSIPLESFASDEPQIGSGVSAILIDTKTNKILYSKDETKRMFPASTTKIVTGILAIENCSLNDKVVASYNAISSVPSGYTTADIKVNEEFTVEQLLDLLFVHSANDAANVLAEHIGGSIDSFVSMMNTKVNELGLTDTHFTNPYGLQDENHYSTAKDLSIIMKYCLENDTFRKLSGQASCAIPATNMSGPRKYSSTNEMLIAGNSNYYPYLIAGKTGYTSQANGCLVSAAYRNDIELVCAVLGSDDRFGDSRLIYNYGYNNFSLRNIVNEGDVVTSVEVKNASSDTKNLNLLVSETIPVLANNSDNLTDIKPTISLNSNISAPLTEGTELGKVTYTVNGVSYTSTLVAANDVDVASLNYVYIVIATFVIVVLVAVILILTKRNIKT